MDVKTLLLLGIGMVVLTLVGFCAARARSAELISWLGQPVELDLGQAEAAGGRLPETRQPFGAALAGAGRLALE